MSIKHYSTNNLLSKKEEVSVNLSKQFNTIKLWDILLGLILQVLFTWMFVVNLLDYVNGITPSEKLEQNMSNAVGYKVDNETHFMGVLVESADSLNLYHPLISFVILAVFTGFFISLVIAYFQQKNKKSMEDLND